MFSHELGGGVTLAPLEPWHASEFLAAVENDREHMLDAIPFSHTVRTRDDARTFLQRFADAHARDERHLAGIWDGPKLVGAVMFVHFDTRHQVCEIGVWISQEYEGRGLIRAAAGHLIDWAFARRGMRRVAWINNVENDRSAAAARRLGFTREGVRRQSFIVAEGGPSTDGETWSLLASEWPAAQATPIR